MTRSCASPRLVSADSALLVSGGRLAEPRTVTNVHQLNTIAHGAMLIGGTFTDVTNFNPTVSRLITDDVNIDEPLYPFAEWYPAQIGVVNRFLSILDGQSHEQLVVVPAQFYATTTTSPTIGTQRLYSNLKYLIYHAPFTDTDFNPPTIWQVRGTQAGAALRISAVVNDDSGQAPTVVLLYRALDSRTWLSATLPYSATTQPASLTINGVRKPVEFFIQAVDGSGNVALALDHGNPYQVTVFKVYLPLVRKNK